MSAETSSPSARTADSGTYNALRQELGLPETTRIPITEAQREDTPRVAILDSINMGMTAMFRLFCAGEEVTRPQGDDMGVAYRLRHVAEFVQQFPEASMQTAGIKDREELKSVAVAALSQEWARASLGIPLTQEGGEPSSKTSFDADTQRKITQRSESIQPALHEALHIAITFPPDAIEQFANHLFPRPNQTFR